MKTKTAQKRKNNRRFLITALAVLLIVGGVLLWRSKHHNSRQSQATTHTQNTSSSSASPNYDSTQSSNDKQQNSPPIDSNGQAILLAPNGNFISNHSPSLDPSSSRNAENSACVTTAGATCNIEFINGTTTKSLGDKTTNGDGVALWDWTPQGIGLTQGTWQVKVTVTLNGTNKTVQDPINLQVGP